MSGSDARIMFSTVPSMDEAEKIAAALLDARKAACVNVVPGIRSHYRWRGKVEHDDELLLIIKTRAAALGDAERILKENHSYETPEVVAVEAAGGSADYLKWIDDEVEA